MTMKQVNVGFNRNFKEFNECKKRYRLAKGSAGSGKSVNIAQNFIIKLGDPKYKGANLLCVRKVDTTNKDSTYAELKSAIYKIYGDKAGLFWQIKSNPMELISKVTGNKVIFRGMKDDGQREKVKSITFDVGKLHGYGLKRQQSFMKRMSIFSMTDSEVICHSIHFCIIKSHSVSIQCRQRTG